LSPLLVAGLLVMMLASGAAVYLHRHDYVFPGPLSAVDEEARSRGGYDSHAAFEQECTHCHAPVHCVTAAQCQECHVEIARQRREAIGLHSLLPGGDNCQHCHVEHQGRTAVISQVAFANVDHAALSGFSLAAHEVGGDGAPVQCADCHENGRFAAAAVSCIACHQDADETAFDAHRRDYGEDCLACHDGEDAMSDFAHDAVYPLQGGHQDLACVACHGAAQFVAPRHCADCHEEAAMHAGQFGQDCARCHTAVSWTPARLTHHTFPLDHGLGEDAAGETNDCLVCHAESYTAVTCAACHSSLANQLLHPTLIGPDVRCIACHPGAAAADPASRSPLPPFSDVVERKTP
jgi:hypothetical protein